MPTLRAPRFPGMTSLVALREARVRFACLPRTGAVAVAAAAAGRRAGPPRRGRRGRKARCGGRRGAGAGRAGAAAAAAAGSPPPRCGSASSRGAAAEAVRAAAWRPSWRGAAAASRRLRPCTARRRSASTARAAGTPAAEGAGWRRQPGVSGVGPSITGLGDIFPDSAHAWPPAYHLEPRGESAREVAELEDGDGHGDRQATQQHHEDTPWLTEGEVRGRFSPRPRFGNRWH